MLRLAYVCQDQRTFIYSWFGHSAKACPPTVLYITVANSPVETETAPCFVWTGEFFYLVFSSCSFSDFGHFFSCTRGSALNQSLEVTPLQLSLHSSLLYGFPSHRHLGLPELRENGRLCVGSPSTISRPLNNATMGCPICFPFWPILWLLKLWT